VPLSRTILAGVRQEQTGVLQVSQYTGTALGVAVLVGVFAAATRGGATEPGAPATGMLTAAVFAVGIALLALVADRPAAAPAAAPTAGEGAGTR
jgi:hypothetical protein